MNIIMQISYRWGLGFLSACFFVGIGLFFLASSGGQPTIPTTSDCANRTAERQADCWLEKAISYLEIKGVAAAVQHISDAVQTEAAMAGECHALMHAIGEHSYHLYTKDLLFGINQTVTYCTYGFYHGFITESVVSDGDFAVAREFCSFINEALSKIGFTDSDAECYHGFGHAVVDDHITAPFITAHEVADVGLKLCTDLSDTLLQYRNCAGGVYNGVANLYLDGIYPWPELEEDDPLRICTSQPKEIQSTCYAYFARVVLQYAEYDFDRALQAAEKIPPGDNQHDLVSNLSVSLAPRISSPTAFNQALATCRNLDTSKLHQQCVWGLAVGLVQFASPGQEYTKQCDYVSRWN